MVMVVAVVSINQSGFNGAVLLRGQAYETALAIREVQLNAVSAAGDSGNFRSVYGVQFDVATERNDRYVIFKDTPAPSSEANGFYDPGHGEEYGSPGLLDSRFEIREIRTIPASASPMENLAIVFVRPNFDARFFKSTGELDLTSVEIDIARRGKTGAGPGEVRTVEVTSTGQISVQNIP